MLDIANLAAPVTEQDDNPNLEIKDEIPEPCLPCRGTGKVISGLGGSPNSLPCPWCEGRGMRVAQIDAQSRWTEGQQNEPAPEQAT